MKLELKEYQKPHFKKILDILVERSGALDLSKAGLGKTIIAIAVSLALKLPLFVICPKTMISAWEESCRKYNATLLEIYSYQSFKGKSGKQPNHQYLIRSDIESLTIDDEGNAKSMIRTEFNCTSIMKELLDKGCLFICDEFQEVKNNSAQSKAVATVIQDLIHTTTRYLFLSRTPIENINQAIHLMRVFQFIDKPRLYFKDQTGNYNYEGALQIIRICDIIDEESTNVIIEDSKPHTQTSIREMCFKLFYSVLIPEISSSMVDDQIETFVNDTKNGFYDVSHEDALLIQKGLDILKQEVTKFAKIAEIENEKSEKNNTEENTEEKKKGTLRAKIIPAMRYIEFGKSGIFSRKAIEDLTKDPDCKILIALHFLDSIKEVYQKVSQNFSCEMLTGSLTLERREEIIRLFQENSNKIRCIIFQIKVGGVGVSFHDIFGNHPRKMYISPGYEMSIIYQASMRIYRQGIKSDAQTRIVYAKGISQEMRILDALARKTETLKKIISTDSLRYDKFPGDFEQYIEGQLEIEIPKIIHSVEGVFKSSSYRLNFEYLNERFNPWHRIPGLIDLERLIVSMVVETPKNESYCMRLSTTEDGGSILHVIEEFKGSNRNSRLNSLKILEKPNLFNFGYIPQTFEDGDIIDPNTDLYGNNRPLNIIEISEYKNKTIYTIGSIIKVKIIGAIPVILQNSNIQEWFLIGISMDNPLSKTLEEISNTEYGIRDLLIESIKNYFNPEIPIIGINSNTFIDSTKAFEIYKSSHLKWKNLMEDELIQFE